jgi:hypothetical protein
MNKHWLVAERSDENSDDWHEYADAGTSHKNAVLLWYSARRAGKCVRIMGAETLVGHISKLDRDK